VGQSPSFPITRHAGAARLAALLALAVGLASGCHVPVPTPAAVASPTAPTPPQVPPAPRPEPAAETPPPARAATVPPATEAPRPMAVPDLLRRATRFEPSGLWWSTERDRFVIVSDDTGWPDRDDKAPWLFLMDADGGVEARPVPIAGLEKVNDLESITRAPDGAWWVLSSQTFSRRGRRPDARTRLVRLASGPDGFVARGSVSLARAIAALGPDAWDTLGLVAPAKGSDPDGFDRLLNIEGMTATPDGLLLGLKQPLDASGRATIWRLADPERLLRTGRLAPGDLAVWARIALHVGEGAARRPAGISDLARLPDGRLAILAVAQPGSGPDHGALWIADGLPHDGSLTATRVRDFPGRKAEGVAPGTAADEVTIVFDADQGTPAWTRVSLPR